MGIPGFDDRVDETPAGEVLLDLPATEEASRVAARSLPLGAEGHFRVLIESIKDSAVFMLDARGFVITWNDAATQLFGYPEDEALGRHYSSFYSSEDVRLDKPARQLQIASAEGRYEDEGWRLKKGDARFWANVVLTALRDDDGIVVAFAHVTRDITERKHFEEQLAHQALHDPLTGLPNRILFLDRLRLALTRAERNRTKVAVLFLDLDRFKFINDSLGHSAGDQILTSLGHRLQTALRPSDTVARFGGDEFTILCEDISTEAGVGEIVDRITQTVERPFAREEDEVFVTASIGVTFSSENNNSAETLLRDADMAMHQAKQQGRARHELFHTGLREQAVERREIESALRRALDRDEFRILYQPQVDLRDGKVVGVEALLRWERPEQGLVAPLKFITLAEETGLIVPIGAWVLQKACLDARRWIDSQANGEQISVTVNLSARQLAQRNLAELVSEAITDAGIDPTRLCLEITESTLMEEVEFTLGVLRDLKALGLRLSVDDFGTGYSSLSYLRRFPLDVLKVDQSFVSGLGRNKDSSAIVEAIVHLALALGMKPIAEGVETQKQVDELRAMGCGFAQGHYFSTPQDNKAMARIVQRALL
ncbi:MAG TPA: EAL domain-containing protein [Actinomycetota bacterium]|nr:EAL domain-containing protein [Actinomycetota bacterium]